MQSKLLHETNGKRTFAVILQKGDEAMRCLQDFAVKERLAGAQISAIGAFSNAKLAFFDWQTKQYKAIPVEEQVEVASLNGDIAVGLDGKPSVHVHAVLGATAQPWPVTCRKATLGPPWKSSSRNHRRIFESGLALISACK
jgi:predicted DNA-binding protein with PD1-like motif